MVPRSQASVSSNTVVRTPSLRHSIDDMRVINLPIWLHRDKTEFLVDLFEAIGRRWRKPVLHAFDGPSRQVSVSELAIVRHMEMITSSYRHTLIDSSMNL